MLPVFFLVFLLLFPAAALAEQETESEHPNVAHAPTLEFAGASNGSFGNAATFLPVWKLAVASALWYHAQGREVGFVGIGLQVRPKPHIALIPSLYAMRGGDTTDKAALGFRAIIETKYLISDVNVIRAFGDRRAGTHDVFIDPSHVSVRIKQLQIGYAIEFFRHLGKTKSALLPESQPQAVASSDGKHSKNALLHGGRIGWELRHWVHVFYLPLYEGHGKMEHKFGMSVLLEEFLKKKIRRH